MKKPTSTGTQVMRTVGKVYQFLNRFVPTIENKTKGTYLYGVDDLLPNNNLRLINDCGVAKRCVRKKARYIQGDGFSDETAAKLKVNDRQTADKLLQTISSYAAYNEGFALQISRDAEAKIAGVKCIPFQCVRKTLDGNFTYNPKQGQTEWKEHESTRHPAFNPSLTPEQLRENLKNFKGQPEIFYVYEETADNPHYPVPDYNAGIEDIETCIEISKVDLECVTNGFITSGILTTQVIDDVNKGDDNRTPYEHFAEELRTFTGQKKYRTDKRGEQYRYGQNDRYAEAKGGRYKLLHIMVGSMAEAPKLDSYDPKPILEASNTKRDIIAREVCRLFGVHPILVGFSDSQVLGNTQALANVITEFNNYVNPIQRMISDAMKVIYPGHDWNISQFNPITYIPPEVWAQLTPDEIRNIAGFEPLPKPVITPAPVPQPAPNGTN